MADLPFTPAAPGLAERLAACLDIEEKIPRALEALGPVAGRDVVLVDGNGGRRAGQLAELGARVRSVPMAAPGEPLAAADGSADVVVGLWSTFRAPSADEVVEADRVLRPGGRLLVVHDYGRDDVSRLRGDLPEYGAWSRREGWYLTNGFRIRVIHCFWTFESIDEARAFLGDAFGEEGNRVGESLTRSRLSYNVAIYHRTRGGAEPRA
jgi:SAM-dependent methyltransferase